MFYLILLKICIGAFASPVVFHYTFYPSCIVLSILYCTCDSPGTCGICGFMCRLLIFLTIAYVTCFFRSWVIFKNGGLTFLGGIILDLGRRCILPKRCLPLLSSWGSTNGDNLKTHFWFWIYMDNINSGTNQSEG